MQEQLLQHDLRAEVISSLLQLNIGAIDLYANFNGQHRRSFSHDVERLEESETSITKKTNIECWLNRDSLYDTLPEAIFHEPPVLRKNFSAVNMAHEYKVRRMEEQKARSFFAPFDNAFFECRTNQEQRELNQVMAIDAHRFENEVFEFFGVSLLLPLAIRQRFVLCLLYREFVMQNTFTLAAALEILLEQRVTIVKENGLKQELAVPGTEAPVLGVDFTAGNKISIPSLFYSISIGPVSKTAVTKYLFDKIINDTISSFIAFFIPLEAEVTVKIEVDKNDRQLVLGGSHGEGILAFTSVI